LLELIGHSYRFIPEHYSGKLSDKEILKIAREHDEVLIAHDLDFGTLLAFSGDSNPSVIIFRIHHINPDLFYQLLMSCYEAIELPLNEGAIILIDEHSIRIRMLPI
jgi:predicted nuclease of predicted toxin-antitoxin system